MTNKIKCSLCEKIATVHLTQIVNNQIQKIDLCESCASKKGISDSEGYTLAEMLSGTKAISDEHTVKCSTCNLDLLQFKKSGRFGCKDCYEIFENILEPILIEMHPGTHHSGKLPTNSIRNTDYLYKVDKLKDLLTEAIGNEAYEDAAKLRDQLEELKNANENKFS